MCGFFFALMTHRECRLHRVKIKGTRRTGSGRETFAGWHRKACGIRSIPVRSPCDAGCKLGHRIKHDVYTVFARAGIWYNKEQVTKHMKKESFKQADIYYTSKEKSLLPLTKDTLEYAVSINQIMIGYSNQKPIDIIFFLMKNRWRLTPVYWMSSVFILNGSS